MECGPPLTHSALALNFNATNHEWLCLGKRRKVLHQTLVVYNVVNRAPSYLVEHESNIRNKTLHAQ